jgi:hypothetical protein
MEDGCDGKVLRCGAGDKTPSLQRCGNRGAGRNIAIQKISMPFRGCFTEWKSPLCPSRHFLRARRHLAALSNPVLGHSEIRCDHFNSETTARRSHELNRHLNPEVV